MGQKSPLDTQYYLASLKDKEEVYRFIDGYGFDLTNPIQNAELFGIFQEAVQFIKRYFLKEGHPEGLDLMVPPPLHTISDVSDLFLLATFPEKSSDKLELSHWASIILKVMHTILHADKDLRYRYFSTIQTQIFDRFYRYLDRGQDNQLYLKLPKSMSKSSETRASPIRLFHFETKAKKARDSIIIKLLHKKEYVAEELFDRVGLRFVTYSEFDCLRVMKFLTDYHVINVSNIKPSRSLNTMFDLDRFRREYFSLLKNTLREKFSEEGLLKEAEARLQQAKVELEKAKKNIHSASEYRAIHFTCRQLIQFRNPFVGDFEKIKQLAKDSHDQELAQKILGLDTSTVSRDIRFFYPFEIQIVDKASHEQNTIGEASHREYKTSQLLTARDRLFKGLLSFLKNPSSSLTT